MSRGFHEKGKRRKGEEKDRKSEGSVVPGVIAGGAPRMLADSLAFIEVTVKVGRQVFIHTGLPDFGVRLDPVL